MEFINYLKKSQQRITECNQVATPFLQDIMAIIITNKLINAAINSEQNLVIGYNKITQIDEEHNLLDNESLFSNFSLNNILSIIHGIKFIQQANKNETNPTKKAIISNLVSDFNNMQAKNYTEDDIINVYHKYYSHSLANQNLQDLIKHAIKQIDPDLKIANDTALNLTISLKDIY